MSASRKVQTKTKVDCYLCKNNIPHSVEEHEEVCEGGLRAKHKRRYPGMSGHGHNPTLPEEANHRLAGDASDEERIRHYMKHGRTRAYAHERLALRAKAQRKKAESLEVTNDMNTNDVSNLTKRSKEILKLLAEGLTNKQIAAKLDISEKTVKAHVTNVLQGLGVKSRTQAAIGYLQMLNESAQNAEAAPQAAVGE